MVIVKSNFEILGCLNTLEDLEKAVRVCYKSEDKITAGSAERLFSKTILPLGHNAVLEHGRMILHVSKPVYESFKGIANEVSEDLYVRGTRKYFEMTETKLESPFTRYIISGNLRSFLDVINTPEIEVYGENQIHNALKSFWPVIFPTQGERYFKQKLFCCGDIAVEVIEPHQLTGREENLVHNYTTIRTVMDRGVSHQWVKERTFSMAQESTRYVNYKKKGLSFIDILPAIEARLSLTKDEVSKSKGYHLWEEAMKVAETAYLSLIDQGWPPELARSVLPQSLKTEMVTTAPFYVWNHFLKLRTSTHAHPQIRELAIPIQEALMQIPEYNRAVTEPSNDN